MNRKFLWIIGVCIIVGIPTIIFLSPKQKQPQVEHVAPTPTAETVSGAYVSYLDSQYSWTKVPVAKQELSQQAVYIEKGKDGPNPHALKGEEYVTEFTVTKNQQKSESYNIDSKLLQSGWSQNRQSVADGTLQPIAASGPTGGIYGYSRIDHGTVQIYLIATTAKNLQFENPSGNEPLRPKYPYTRELRVFISDPTPIAELFAK